MIHESFQEHVKEQKGRKEKKMKKAKMLISNLLISVTEINHVLQEARSMRPDTMLLAPPGKEDLFLPMNDPLSIGVHPLRRLNRLAGALGRTFKLKKVGDDGFSDEDYVYTL